MNLWDVVYNGYIIGTVEFPANVFKSEVKDTLVSQGYSAAIEVHSYPYEG